MKRFNRLNPARKLFHKENFWKTVVFFVFSILLGIAVLKHEPWFDEAQAWLLARDASLPELLTKYLRYEGSPGLWHVLLLLPAKLGLPYYTINIISALLSAAGAYLFLRYSPFPRGIKLLYPFTYFAFYQYGVVARSYCLIPVLLFLIAIVYKSRVEKPFRFFLLLILLANVCFQGVIIAASLVLIHVFTISRLGRDPLNRSLKYKNFGLILLFGILLFLIKLQLEMPDDLVSAASGIKADLSGFFSITIPALLNSFAVSNISEVSKYDLSNIFVLLSGITFVFSLFWLFISRKFLLYFMPLLGLLAFYTIVYVNAWHMGILFFVWIFVLWLSFEKTAKSHSILVRRARKAMVFLMVLIFLVQIYWTVCSFRYDFNSNYSASREAAGYIKENRLEEKKIYVTSFHSISILPYFKENIFINHNGGKPPSFWLWSFQNSMYTEPALATDKYDPDIIIIGEKYGISDMSSANYVDYPDISGYTLKKQFTGALFWKDHPLETDTFLIFEKSQ